ncbi:MAG: response regulator transcription factor [Pseudomonadota bacterium]
MKSKQPKLIRVLLADDHPLLRTGFAASLVNHGIDVVGLIATHEEVIKKYEELVPDVLVLDIQFGQLAIGLNVGKDVLNKFPDAKIIFLSQFDHDGYIKEAYKIGGFSFITKNFEPAELEVAIKKAYEGETYFPPGIAERLAYLSIRGDSTPLSALDSRETEVLKLIAQGLILSEIAEQTGLSLKTITNTSQSIKEKLGLHRPADLARLALKHGLIKL